MRAARLLVDASTISVRQSAPATGDIAIDVRGVVFPGAGWNDFVVVVLGAFLTALVRLLRHATEVERVHFMEGPYAIDMRRLGTGAILVRALDRPDRERASAEVLPDELAHDAMGAAEAVVVHCRRGRYESADLVQLETALSELRAEVERAERAERGGDRRTPRKRSR